MKHLVLIMLVLSPSAAYAHPESGFLPDAVAEMEYKIVLEINPQDIVTGNKLGIVLYNKNKLDEAKQAFTRVLRTSPWDFDAHDGMGLVMIKEKKYAEAVSWFKKAIAILPEDVMVHYHLGFAHEQRGDFNGAECAYKKALTVNDALLRKGANKDVESEKRAIVLSALKNLQTSMEPANTRAGKP